MPDRLKEIRARLDAWTRQTDAMEAWEKLPKAERGYLGEYVAAACGCGHNLCGTADEWYPVWQHEGEVYEHAQDDIAWLLDRVEALEYVVESQRIKPLDHDPTAKRCRCIVCHRTEVAP